MKSQEEGDAAVAAYGEAYSGDEPEYANVNDSNESFFSGTWFAK